MYVDILDTRSNGTPKYVANILLFDTIATEQTLILVQLDTIAALNAIPHLQAPIILVRIPSSVYIPCIIPHLQAPIILVRIPSSVYIPCISLPSAILFIVQQGALNATDA